MIVTNNAGLPGALWSAAMYEGYDRGGADLSVTQLVDAPRIVALVEEHNDRLQVDVSELVPAIIGRAVHRYLESVAGTREDDPTLTEARYFADVLGWRLSGQLDSLGPARRHPDPAKRITDYKVVSVNSVRRGGGSTKFAWIAQLNCYAYLARVAAGHDVRELEVCAIYHDWKAQDAAMVQSRLPYPEKRAEIIAVPVWKDDVVRSYIERRVLLHQSARLSLPECDGEDRWSRPTQYAVMGTRRKRALRVFPTRSEADQFLRTYRGSDEPHIHERPGEETRCRSYCPVRYICRQREELGVVPDV